MDMGVGDSDSGPHTTSGNLPTEPAFFNKIKNSIFLKFVVNKDRFVSGILLHFSSLSVEESKSVIHEP